MKRKMSTTQELIPFATGFAIFFPLNYLLKKQLIHASFDLLNLVSLVGLISVTLLQIYWKFKKHEGSLAWDLIWVGLLGGAFGAWVTSRFVTPT